MTAKFAPEDILKPRNPAIPPQRRCFSSKSCFFFLRRRAHRRQTTVFTTPKRVLTNVFSVFALLNQPRFAFQPASFHFFQFQKISRFHSNFTATLRVPHSNPDSQHTLFKSPSPIVNAWARGWPRAWARGPGHPRHPAGRGWMQDGQSSAAAPAVSGAAVPAVNVDAPNLSRNVSASNATHPDPAPSATGAGSDDYRVPSTPGPHHSVAQHGGGADGTPSRSHIGVLSGAQVTPSVSTGTPMSCQPTPEAPSAGVRSRRSLADQLPDGPSSSTQECQPDAHITLDELTTWFKDVKLLQTGPNAAAPTVFKSSQAIRQGIEVFGHLLGMKGTNARAQGELHNWKSTPANKVLALDTSCRQHCTPVPAASV